MSYEMHALIRNTMDWFFILGYGPAIALAALKGYYDMMEPDAQLRLITRFKAILAMFNNG